MRTKAVPLYLALGLALAPTVAVGEAPEPSPPPAAPFHLFSGVSAAVLAAGASAPSPSVTPVVPPAEPTALEESAFARFPFGGGPSWPCARDTGRLAVADIFRPPTMSA